MKNSLYSLSLLILLLILTSCGDLLEKDVKTPQLKPGRLGNECELNMDEIALILEKNVSTTINCLGTKLEAFMDYEELGQGNYLSRVSLINYLTATQTDLGPETHEIINSVFYLNHLITGEKKDFITRDSVRKIVNLALVFNRQAALHFDRTFRSTTEVNLDVHQMHRKRIAEAAGEIKKAIKEIFVPWRDGEIHSLDIVKLVDSFIKQENSHTVEKSRGILFVKRIILGGEKETLTHVELGRLFENLPKILSLVLDGVRFKYLTLDQQSMLRLVNDDLKIVNDIIFDPSLGNRNKEEIFSLNEAIDGVQQFFNEKDSLTKFRALFHEGLRILTKKEPEVSFVSEVDTKITGADLERIFSHGQILTAKGLAFHRLYQSPKLSKLLASPTSLNLNPKDFEEFFPNERKELADFTRIANKFRFQRGTFDVAYYSLDYKRNASAFFEITAYEYLIKLVFRFYGSSLSMSVEQVKALLKKFENELIETGILMPRRYANTAETITLLGSLFQYQSDNNKVLDVNEAAEFAISLVTAMSAQKVLYSYLEKKGCEKDDFGRLDPMCFRRYFLNGICTNYKQYFPRLFEYLGMKGSDCEQNFQSAGNREYLDKSIRAARFCHIYDNGEEIYYSQGDIMSTLLAMMHIETTILRWDTNLNNTMDYNEVMKAYEIYEPAIQGMLPKLPDILNKPDIVKALAKVVYKYLVKYETTPELKGAGLVQTVQRLLQFNLQAPAHRKTIASILTIVSEQSKIKSIEAGEPQFDCEWMRDPDNIPRD
jgi:hypothetical protein